MSLNHIDKSVEKKINELKEKILDGYLVSETEARWLFNLPARTSIVPLVSAAAVIRDSFRGRHIQLCSIVNAKSGGCSEDCKFCAQSSFNKTNIPRYGFLSKDEICNAIERTRKMGVRNLGFVAAWPGLKSGELLDEVCDRLKEASEIGAINIHASFGNIPDTEVAARLREVGVVVYNHNLETSPSYFPNICSTHTQKDRISTIEHLKEVGIKICSGGIIGMGETSDDRCELALTLRKVGVDILPINIFNPIAGTALSDVAPMEPIEAIKTIACFRLTLPRVEIILAGGRPSQLRDVQSLAIFAGISGLMVGDYLTTQNQPIEKDLKMLDDLGFRYF
jgi:biotin synthase